MLWISRFKWDFLIFDFSDGNHRALDSSDSEYQTTLYKLRHLKSHQLEVNKVVILNISRHRTLHSPPTAAG